MEFDLILRGSASYALDDRIYMASAGTLIWIAPGQRHKLLRRPNLQMWVVLFRASLLAPGWLEDLAAQPSRVISSHELIDLDGLLSQVAQDSDEPEAYNAGVSYVVMRALRASRDRPAASMRPLHPAVTRALLIMRREGGASSLTSLAAEAGIAAHYLSRLLVEQTGHGFVDWRNRIRLDRFMVGYRPGANLLAAALDAGFGSYPRFHHIFNEVVGCSPSEWAGRLDEGRPAPRGGAVAAAGRLPAGGARLLERPPALDLAHTAGGTGHPGPAAEGFMERPLAASPGGAGRLPPHIAGMETALSEADMTAFVDSIRPQDPELAEDYGRLLAAHDFAQVHARVLGFFDSASARLVDVVSSTIAMLWSAKRDVDVTVDEAQAVKQQVGIALAAAPPPIDMAGLRAAHVALMLHFVVVFQAVQAARASGDERLLDAIRAVGRAWSPAVLGTDVAELALTTNGFFRLGERPRGVAGDALASRRGGLRSRRSGRSSAGWRRRRPA